MLDATSKRSRGLRVKNSSYFSKLKQIATSVTGMLVAVSMLCVAFVLPTTAMAQEGSAGALLEEIVTTARKRSNAEAVQDVPIAVTAFGAAQIEALFVQKIDDLGYLMPNVQMEQIGTFPGVQSFSIRGQGINSSIPSVDPTVGVFVDGVYLGTTFGVVLDTFDIESVEVLRGPQGLLFGRNVTGGAVLVRNARPNGEFGFRAKVRATDYDEVVAAVAIEGSLVEDKLAAKLVLYQSDNPGYFPNPTNGTDVGELDTTLIRPTFVWTPNDTTDVTLIWENGNSEGDGAAWTSVSLQQAGALPEFTTVLNDIGFTDIEWNQVTLEANFEVAGGTLTNILGYREVEADSATDVDGIQVPIFFVPGDVSQDQISNELRWSGSLSDSWETTVGLYFFEQDISYREGRFIQGGALLVALGGDMNAKNFGVFWNNDFFINDSWTLTAGIRYTDEEKTAQIISGVGGGCSDVINFNCTFDNLKGDWSNITPKIGVQWNFNDDSQLYGFWTKGFRSGGFNFRNAKPNIIPPGPTTEEENNTFEIGLKTDFANGRARLNLAVFQNQIDDIQREINVGDPDVVVLQATLNAGDVTINGFEAEFIALLTDNFSINASYGWQEGDYDRIDPQVAGIEAALGITVIGGELPRLAPTNYSLGFSWDIPTGRMGVFNVASSYSWREEHFYDDSNLNKFEDQKRFNASINWLSPSDSWQVSLYGKNMNDQPNYGNLTSIAGLYIAGPMQIGSVYGLEVNFRM